MYRSLSYESQSRCFLLWHGFFWIFLEGVRVVSWNLSVRLYVPPAQLQGIMYPEWIRKWEAYEEELSLDLRAASPLLASAGQGSWGIGLICAANRLREQIFSILLVSNFGHLDGQRAPIAKQSAQSWSFALREESDPT